jgi:hypothetical protein
VPLFDSSDKFGAIPLDPMITAAALLLARDDSVGSADCIATALTAFSEAVAIEARSGSCSDQNKKNGGHRCPPH